MKVVHITFSDTGGAGLAAFRIHSSLRAIGIDSWMLVCQKESKDPTVVKVEKSSLNSFVLPKNRFIRKIKRWLHKRGFFKTELESHADYVKALPADKRSFFTSPLSCYDLRHHPILEDADILHLHWIENYVDYRTFFPWSDKPIVWTFHDEGIGFGGFHYQREFEAFYPYYKPLEDKYRGIKTDSFSRIADLTMISLSKEMDEFCHKRSLLKDRPSVVIPNGVDYSKYIIHDKSFSKSVFKISSTSIVLMFCAYRIHEPRKGLSVLLDALEALDIPDLVLFCIGEGDLPRPTSVSIYRAGYVTNEDILSLMYSAADLFVMPSYQEAFAQTPLEALSCGVPVVAFPVSGASVLINDSNGVRCADFTASALTEGLEKALKTRYDAQAIREDVIRRFSPTVIAHKYLNVYDEVVHHHRQ